MIDIILTFINWALVVGGVLGVVGVISLVPAAIVIFVLISNEKDEVKKKAKIKKGIIFAVMPFALIIFSLLGITIIQAVKALLKG